MIRAFRNADAARFLIVNTDCVPEVGLIDERRLALLARLSPYFQIVEVDGQVAGGLIGLVHGAHDYPSPNYRWFSERHQTFAYVDRILLAGPARNLGYGAQLYEAFARWARDQELPVLCAEVNTIPNNPGSHRFHQRQGFVEVARLRPYSPDAEVAMYERVLPGDASE